MHRVIFIATPHRGSKFADNIVGRAASGTVKLPDAFKDLWRRITEANPDVTALEMKAILRKGGPTSIRALSPEHPLMRVMSEIPIDQRVSYHLIIGDRGRGGGDAASDGVVTYASAHTPGAESEVIVPTGHKAYAYPLAIAEIKRILAEMQKARALAGLPPWGGRIVIDATNPISMPGFEVADLGGRTSSEVVAEMLPGARLVKAFNTLTPEVLGADPHEGGGQRVIFFSGNDSTAKAEFARLLKDVGFAGIDLGGLVSGGRMQQFPRGPLPTLNLIKLH